MSKFSSMTEAELLCEIWEARENVKYAIAKMERSGGAGSFVKYLTYGEYLRYSKYLKHLECEYLSRGGATH
jgi:hypothetical protein